jgi:hypothetical protein
VGVTISYVTTSQVLVERDRESEKKGMGGDVTRERVASGVVILGQAWPWTTNHETWGGDDLDDERMFV